MNPNPLPLAPFTFIRHGETDWNRRRIIMGSQDMPLNEVGLQQAEEAARLLKKEDFDVIVSSPLRRAQQTADIIAKKTNKSIVLEPGLAERSWGVAEGKPVETITSECDDAQTPVGAETYSAFQDRVVTTISSVLQREKLPLIVSHSGVFRILVRTLGYTHLDSFNATPFFFKPPDNPAHPWMICNLGGEKD